MKKNSSETCSNGSPPAGSLKQTKKLAIFVSFSGEGGVEKMIVNLCHGLVDQGFQVDLLLVKTKSAYLNMLPDGVRQIPLGSSHTYACAWPLSRYFTQEKPDVLLAVKSRAGETAVFARWISGHPVRIVMRLGTTVSAALKGRGLMRKLNWYGTMRLFYPRIDAIVAVSNGVAKDVMAITGMPESKAPCVIANPVVTPRIFELAQHECDHPWFKSGEPPVILGVGRLTRQKDFSTLIKAFARLRQSRNARLVILGHGGDKEALVSEAASLGIEDDVAFPGFVDNPYTYLSRAKIFVLSSIWEGSPNVLTEALALGIPVVSTDCPSGPHEILQGGRIAPLIPVKDVESMAQAMASVLDDPPEGETLKQAVLDYGVDVSTKHYLSVLYPKNKTPE